MKHLPPSNYPIIIAIMLLAATATILAIGDEKRAEELAVYAYYFLVIGVVIRFFELALPEGTLRKLSQAGKYISGIIKQNGPVVIQKTGIMLKKLYATLQPYLHSAIFNMKMRISGIIKQHGPVIIQKTGIMLKKLYATLQMNLHSATFKMKTRISAYIKQHPPEKTGEDIQKIGNRLKPHYLKLRRLHIVKPEKSIAVISEISKNIAILLSVFFIISLIYGWIIDWWFVERYLSNLVLFILGFLTLHIFTRVRF